MAAAFSYVQRPAVDLPAVLRRSKKFRRTSITLPPSSVPVWAEQQLTQRYVAIVRGWHEGFRSRIGPEYHRSLVEVGKAAPTITRDSATDLTAAVASTDDSVGASIDVFGDWLAQWARAVSTQQWTQFVAQLNTATNINIGTMIGPIDDQATIETVIARNMSLARNISDTLRHQVGDLVFRSYQQATPLAEVAKQVQQMTGVQRDRAMRIASDQTVKLAASLDREKHLQLGITQFTWRHSHKLHFRPEHKARDGMVFDWDSPVGRLDPPGWLPYCGCKAQAYINLEADAGSEDVPGSRPALVPPRAALALITPRAVAAAEQNTLAELEGLLAKLESKNAAAVAAPKPRAPKVAAASTEYTAVFPWENVTKGSFSVADSGAFYKYTNKLQTAPVANGPVWKALNDYQEGDYSDINSGLRTMQQMGGTVVQHIGEHYAGIVTRLDTFIAESNGIPANLKAYMGVRDLSAILKPAEQVVGFKFTDGGFRSTALDPRSAYRFSGGSQGAIFDVEIPAGTKGIGLDSALQSRGQRMYESEVLLDRSTEFEIMEIGTRRIDGNVKKWLRVRVVPKQ